MGTVARSKKVNRVSKCMKARCLGINTFTWSLIYRFLAERMRVLRVLWDFVGFLIGSKWSRCLGFLIATSFWMFSWLQVISLLRVHCGSSWLIVAIMPPFPTFSTSKLTLQMTEVPWFLGLGTPVMQGVSHVEMFPLEIYRIHPRIHDNLSAAISRIVVHLDTFVSHSHVLWVSPKEWP